MDIRVRRGVPGDAASLQALDSALERDPSRAQLIVAWLEEGELLVAESEGRPVAYAVFNHSFYRQGTVEMLMVAANHRGKRVGEVLLKSIEESCDTPRLWISTNLSNQRMHGLLRRMHFLPSGYISGLDPNDPEVVYFKDVAVSPGPNNVL